MSSDERAEFLVWYKDKIDSGEQFDFQKEIVEYCQSDVHILRNACLRFREIILSITGTQEVHFDEKDGALDTKCKGGIDPFQLITIASLCMRIFKSKFLPENWEIKVTNNNEISDSDLGGYKKLNTRGLQNQHLHRCLYHMSGET